MRHTPGVTVCAFVAITLAGSLAFGNRAATPPRDSAEAVLAKHPAPVRVRLERRGIAILEEASSDGYVRAFVRFEQPKPRTLRLLSQTGRHAEFRPELQRVESHGWNEQEALDTHRMKIVFMDIDYRLRTRFDFERAHIRWELDPSYENGLEEVEGYWELYDWNGTHTLGRFGTKVSVGANLPEWLQEAATRKNIPAAMEHVRQWVNTNGRYRP